MSRNVRSLFVSTVLLFGIFTSGCSLLPTLKKGGRELVLEPTFVRSTQTAESFSYRRLNRMTPLVTKKTVIQGNAVDGLVNYDRKTGQEIWRIDLENGVEGGAELAADTLFFGAGDGLLRSVDAVSGKTNWSVPMRAELLSAPTLDRGILIAQTGADVLYGLEAESGKLLWTYNRQVTGNLSVRSSTRPVVYGDNVLAGFSDGYLVALRKRDGVVQWERKLGKGNRFRDVDSTPAINGKKAYVASYDGLLVALNLDSGEVIWQSDFGGYLPVTIGTGAYADRLYFSTIDGRVLEIEEATGKELRAIKLSTGIATQPLITKKLLIFGESEGAIRVIDLDSLKTVAHYSSGEGILSTPFLDTKKNELWFVSSTANLYALKLSYRRVAERFPWKRLESSPTSSSF
ncbi:MAG: PQQ-binding-like beta-propeller repeat protein [Deltaproteobacteria bacterium]|nr:PQQ-binding-like beta-propeller repeat protein [Deltaproteobacteria bacterium]